MGAVLSAQGELASVVLLNPRVLPGEISLAGDEIPFHSENITKSKCRMSIPCFSKGLLPRREGLGSP